MLSRAWYLIGGVLLAASLFGAGYYLAYERVTDRWTIADAMQADSADSARARAGRAGVAADAARGTLDSAITALNGWVRAHPPRVIAIHDTVHARSDTSSVFFGQAWWHPGLDQLQMRDERDTAVAAVKACQAVVSAAVNYRTACEAVRDSLTRLLVIASRRPVAAPPRRFGVVAGIGPSFTSDGRWRWALSLTAGWRLW